MYIASEINGHALTPQEYLVDSGDIWGQEIKRYHDRFANYELNGLIPTIYDSTTHMCFFDPASCDLYLARLSDLIQLDPVQREVPRHADGRLQGYGNLYECSKFKVHAKLQNPYDSIAISLLSRNLPPTQENRLKMYNELAWGDRGWIGVEACTYYLSIFFHIDEINEVKDKETQTRQIDIICHDMRIECKTCQRIHETGNIYVETHRPKRKDEK